MNRCAVGDADTGGDVVIDARGDRDHGCRRDYNLSRAPPSSYVGSDGIAGFRPERRVPVLSTTPATSPDGENGNSGFVWYFPRVINVSKKFSAAAPTFDQDPPASRCLGNLLDSDAIRAIEALAKRGFHM